MKNAKTVLFGILAMTVALSALVAPAAAAKFVHPRGLMMSTYPQDIAVFWGKQGNYERTLAVWIKPPWYFVEDLMGFNSVTLTITIASNCYQCKQYGPNPPKLLGADSTGTLVVQWQAITLADGGDGGIDGALLLCPITFVISSSTSRGYYMLFLSATAEADGATFQGWDQIPVAVTPGGP